MSNARLAVRAVIVWLMIIAAETVHGVMRTLLLHPLVGEIRAKQIAVFTGSAIIFAVAYFSIPYLATRSAVKLLAVGAAWVVLTVAFEVVLGLCVMGIGTERMIAEYDIRTGSLMPLGLVFMMFASILAARLRRGDCSA